MLIQKDISNVIAATKAGMDGLITKIKTLESNGEDASQVKNKLIISLKWIDILIDYLENNFDDNGNLVPATQECLSQDEVILIMSKLAAEYGNKDLNESDWLLKDYVWDDDGFWRDSAFWNEVRTIT